MPHAKKTANKCIYVALTPPSATAIKKDSWGGWGGIKRERDEGSEETDGSALPAAIFSPQMTLRQAEAKLLFQPQRLTFGMQTNPTATNQKRNNLVQIIITRKPQLLYCCISPPPPSSSRLLDDPWLYVLLPLRAFFCCFFAFLES